MLVESRTDFRARREGWIPTRLGFAARSGAALLITLCGLGGCQALSSASSGGGSRCAVGLVQQGPRCCAPGQAVVAGNCQGKPSRCPEGWVRTEIGCTWQSQAILVPAGTYLVGPNDWESENVAADEGKVAAFWLDATEVTGERWGRCVATGACNAALRAGEPGLPMVQVTPNDAQDFCSWASGRVPRRNEWLRVTAGPSSRRFPWGQTGLVCRRASFGLVRGPCAEGGTTPEWPAARPDGKSELGFYDLVGNVAEIVQAADGSFDVWGGSYKSDHAAQLKSWAKLPYAEPRSDVGFRCAYDRDPAASSSP
jgi:formylglycine-generating enzyme